MRILVFTLIFLCLGQNEAFAGSDIDYCLNLQVDGQLRYSSSDRQKINDLRSFIQQQGVLSRTGRTYRWYTDDNGNQKRVHYDILHHSNSNSNSPLVLYFHAGGFTQGHRCNAYIQFYSEIRYLLSRGIAFATASYRFLDPQNGHGVLRSLEDGRLALQRIRSRAGDYNINKDKVALVGKSAGAGIASWVAYKPEHKNLNSSWAPARESSRVNCVMLMETQATYAIDKWHDVLQPELGNRDLRNYSEARDKTADLFGLANYGQLTQSYYNEYSAKVDMLDLITSDDPRTYIQNIEERDAPLFTSSNPERPNMGVILHHYLHAQALNDKLASKGVTRWVYQDRGDGTSASLTKRKSFLSHSLCLDK